MSAGSKNEVEPIAVEPIAAIQCDLLTLKDGQLDLALSPEVPPRPIEENPFTPQTPSTPMMIRQSSTQFSKFQQELLQKELLNNNKDNNSNSDKNEIVNTETDQKKHDDSTKQIERNTKTEQRMKHQDEKKEDSKEEDSDTFYEEYTSCSDQTDENDESDDDIPPKSDQELLFEKGYEIQGKICDTSQGCIYQAIGTTDSSQQFAIKKTEKLLYSKRISIQNNMNIVTNENIIKEAIILHHLTVDNKATADYIVKFINFFETEHAYFLVMEYVGDVTLKYFCDKAFEYINSETLEIKEYKRIVKYLFWQIAVTLYWMNNDMNCCHLDLNMENIMVQNGTFIEGEDGKMTVNPAITVKIADFGLSEVFKVKRKKKHKDDIKEEDDDKKEEILHIYQYDPYEVDWNNIDKNPFFCRKFGIKNNHQYCAPRMYFEEPYDARSADMWTSGIILFKLATGIYPYNAADSKKDSGYWCIQHNNLRQFVEINNLSKFVSASLLSLLNGLLNMNESERFLSINVIHHQWFKSYYQKYKDRIEQKSISQKQRNKIQKKKMKVFPFYNVNLNKHPSQQ